MSASFYRRGVKFGFAIIPGISFQGKQYITFIQRSISIIKFVIRVLSIALRSLRCLPTRTIILLIHLILVEFGDLKISLTLLTLTCSLVVASSGPLSSLTRINRGNLKLIPFPGLISPTAA